MGNPFGAAGSRAVSVLLALGLLVSGVAGVFAQPSSNEHFQRVWDRTDRPVAEGVTQRTWMWGHQVSDLITEEYIQAPGGERVVQYFDKSRMEINDPGGDPTSPWYVTNGLLVVEMMTGQVRIGDHTDENRFRLPATINVAGDLDDPDGPTYVTLAGLIDEPPAVPGDTLVTRVDRDGTLTSDPALGPRGVTAAYVDDVTNHAIAEPFWQFMNSDGVVWGSGGYTTGPLFENPFYATGRPVTEAYWAEVLVAGTSHDVLVQCFERRCLTYTPDNLEGWRVESGNVGQHYHAWRYARTEAEGRLLFVANWQPEPRGPYVQPDIFSIDANGENLVNLTSDPDTQYATAVWSPDGTQVAFTTQPPWESHIHVMDADGTNQRQLTFDGFSYSPRWSPDGSRIAFERAISDGERQIFVMDADGANQRQLTFIQSDGPGRVEATNPAWSPDGTSIAFSARTDILSPHDNQSTIYVVPSDGGDLQPLHDGPGADVPVWSPDGSMIAFVYRGGGDEDLIGSRLFVMNSDGSRVNEIRLESDQPGRNDHYAPAWSPDGRMLAYVQSQGIYLASPDGTEQTQLAPAGYAPVWSPDGSHIAFIYDGIVVVNVDGTNPALITRLEAMSLDWRP